MIHSKADENDFQKDIVMLELAGLPYNRIEKALIKFQKSHTLYEWRNYEEGKCAEIYCCYMYLNQLNNLIQNSRWKPTFWHGVCPSGVKELEGLPAPELIDKIKQFDHKDKHIQHWASYHWLSIFNVLQSHVDGTDYSDTLNKACKWLEDACYQKEPYEGQTDD